MKECKLLNRKTGELLMPTKKDADLTCQ